MTKVKWIKVWTDMFDDEKMKLIDTLPERDTIHYIWMRLLVQAGKTNANGDILLTEDMPYSDEMLSIIFNRPLDSIKLALRILQNYKLIEINDSNVIKISKWDTHQNVEGMEALREATRKRVAAYRERKKAKKDGKKLKRSKNVNCDAEETDSSIIAEKINERTKQIDKEEKETGVEILTYYEKLLGRTGVLNLASLNAAIRQHGEEKVRLAIDTAIEAGKLSMRYVNGILKNWVNKEIGDREGLCFGGNNFKSNRSEFEDFKPKAPTRLTDEERKRVEAELI